MSSSLFDGVYKELWRRIVPEALTQLELDLMMDTLALEPGKRLLDCMCGYGRHALGLARKGVAVTAIDNAAAYIDEIRNNAEGLPLEAELASVEEFRPRHPYAAVSCMGNSISVLDREQTLAFFRMVANALEPGGRFMLNTWMITEIIAKKFKEKEWYQIREFKYLLDNEYLLQPTRVETRHTVIAPDGTTEEKNDTDYIFSIAEMEQMMNQAGMQLTDAFSTPRKRPWQLGDEYLYLVAQKG